MYVCTCRDQRGTNRSRAEIVVTGACALPPTAPRPSPPSPLSPASSFPDVQSKAIEVTVEAPQAQTARVGASVSFICTARSKVAPRRPGSVLSSPPLPHASVCVAAVAGLHAGLDPRGQREAAQPGHGLQRHPDHPQRPARGRGRVRLHGLQHAGHGRGQGQAPCARLVTPPPAPPPTSSQGRMLPSALRTLGLALTPSSACKSNALTPPRCSFAHSQRCSDRRWTTRLRAVWG